MAAGEGYKGERSKGGELKKILNLRNGERIAAILNRVF